MSFQIYLLFFFNWISSGINDNDDLSCDAQLLVKQVTTEPPNQRQPEQQLASTSHRKKKCRGNRKEQHARRQRRVRKRDLDKATTVSRMDTITETELTTTNTEAIDEPCDSMTAPDEGVSQV